MAAFFVTHATEITELKARLAKAESERDAWRSAGRQENYLAAYSMAEALSLQLDKLEASARQPRAPAAVPGPVTEMPGDAVDPRARQMTELCITFDGRVYRYRGYRYERFADVVNYARLDRQRAFVEPAPPDTTTMGEVQVPTLAEAALMHTLDITFENGFFHWGEYRYDCLEDAVAYARRAHATRAMGNRTQSSTS